MARGTTVGTIARKSKRAKSVERRGGRGGVRGTKSVDGDVRRGLDWLEKVVCVCLCVYVREKDTARESVCV